MKNCPSCNKKPVTFREWGRGVTAFRTQCINCGANLSASISTYIGFAFALILAIGVFVFVVPTIEEVEASRKAVKMVVVGIPIILVALLTYLFCGYKLKPDDVNPFAVDLESREERTRKSIVSAKLMYAVGGLLLLGAIAYMGLHFRVLIETKHKEQVSELLGVSLPESFEVLGWNLEESTLREIRFDGAAEPFADYLISAQLVPAADRESLLKSLKEPFSLVSLKEGVRLKISSVPGKSTLEVSIAIAPIL